MSECSIFRDWARINKLFWLLFTLGKNLVPSLEFQTESRPESWGANPFFVLLSVASSDLSQSFPNPNCAQYLAWVSQNIRGEAAVTREKMILLLCSAWIINSRSPVWQSDCLVRCGRGGAERQEVSDSARVVIPLIRGSLHYDSSLRSHSLSWDWGGQCMTREFDNTLSITSPSQFWKIVRSAGWNEHSNITVFSLQFYVLELTSRVWSILSAGHGYNENQFSEVMAFLFLIYAPIVTPSQIYCYTSDSLINS